MQQVRTLRGALMSQFMERTHVIDALLLAVLAREHVFLLGPAGCGKSAIIRAIAQAIGGVYWETLLTRFSQAEQVFGPISLSGLEHDRFHRVTAGYLPGAHFGFIDETFKASASILNCLLTLLNERVFHNDGQPQPCPLITVCGASNELPTEAKELEALFDRFMLRLDVSYVVQRSSFRALVLASEPSVAPAMTIDELREAHAQVDAIPISDACVEALLDVRDALKKEGIVASDRRWKKTLKLAKASAAMSGGVAAEAEDLGFLPDALWREPKERAKIASVVGPIVDPAGTKANELLDAAREAFTQAQEIRTSSRSDFISKAAKLVEEFGEQRKRLDALATGAGRRGAQVVADARVEIDAMHRELVRGLSSGLGLSGVASPSQRAS